MTLYYWVWLCILFRIFWLLVYNFALICELVGIIILILDKEKVQGIIVIQLYLYIYGFLSVTFAIISIPSSHQISARIFGRYLRSNCDSVSVVGSLAVSRTETLNLLRFPQIVSRIWFGEKKFLFDN